MKILAKVFKGAAALFLVFGLVGPIYVNAATTPSLGSAASYGVVSHTFTNSNTAPQTIINGDVCYTTAPATPPLAISGITVVPCSSTTGTNQGSALANLNDQACTNLGAGDIALDAVTIGANPPGVFPPGCYSSGGAMTITLSTTVTLDGAGTYIFRPGGALTTGANSVVALTNGASACNVFWTPVGATTLGANAALSLTPTFVGNIIDAAGITLGHFANLLGRALAFGGTVTTDANTINTPTCAAESSGTSREGTINVVKTVINDNGGTKVVADFPLFVNGSSVISGATNSFRVPAGIFTVTETNDSNYTRTFSGDCDINGQLNLVPGDNKFCIITNDDIGKPVVVPPVAPLIDVVKVPNPLALPSGPGLVAYTYTLRNIGTVPVGDITMVGDTCRPIVLSSGDINANSKLDINETWVYTCSTTLNETHTNTVVATGWANGLSATDIASATVVVGTPVVPPLIHITKIPNPFTLRAGGGMVTYTEKITNPGTVALSNVNLTDDKCSPMKYINGDTNSDSKLDPTETWTYTCSSNLTKTTMNTASATGEANGLVVRDIAIATVVVANAVPKLPNTGIVGGISGLGNIILFGIIALSLVSIALVIKKRTA